MYYLGVDGGGTKTAFMLVNRSGRIAAHNIQGTCHYIQVGMDTFGGILNEGISELLSDAGIKSSEINYAFFGIPGYGELAEDTPILEELVADVLKSNQFRCGNDVEAGWAGTLACQSGICLVGGTGAIGFGRDQSGNTARAGGWGYYCGDEGSAYWLGKRLISLFGKQADGRQERTALYEIVKNRFNLTRDFDLIGTVYEDLQMQRDKIAELALLLYQAARRGDPEAIEAYKEAAYEYNLIVTALTNKLAFQQDERILVSYCGGVFKAGKYILEPLRKLTAGKNIKLTEPILRPVTGAALYAMVLAGQELDAGVIERLRAEEKSALY
jgi:N-acetylglucosamine kinase-like BadF-type ATPase